MFFQTITHGNSNNEIKQRHRWTRQVEKSKYVKKQSGPEIMNPNDIAIARCYLPSRPLFSEALDELLSWPNPIRIIHPCHLGGSGVGRWHCACRGVWCFHFNEWFWYDLSPESVLTCYFGRGSRRRDRRRSGSVPALLWWHRHSSPSKHH